MNALLPADRSIDCIAYKKEETDGIAITLSIVRYSLNESKLKNLLQTIGIDTQNYSIEVLLDNPVEKKYIKALKEDLIKKKKFQSGVQVIPVFCADIDMFYCGLRNKYSNYSGPHRANDPESKFYNRFVLAICEPHKAADVFDKLNMPRG